MTPGTEILSSQLAARVPGYYPDLDVRAVRIEPVRDRSLAAPAWRTHRTFRARLRLGRGDTRVRLLHTKTGPHVAEEYEMLADLWHRGFGHAGPARIPEPLDLMAESGTLVTEHVPGRRLLVPLALSLVPGVWRLRRAWLGRRMRQVAEWLARFQKATRTGGETTLAAYLDRIAPEVAGAPGPAAALWPKLAAGVRRSRWGWYPVAQAALHKDFSARNVLYDGAGVTVVDWEGGSAWPDEREGPVLVDALTFSTNLLALARLPGVGWRAARAAADEFLGSYRRRLRPELPAELVRLGERIFFIQYLADYASGRCALSPRKKPSADRLAGRLARCLEEGLAP